jgi:hypothetical protein
MLTQFACLFALTLPVGQDPKPASEEAKDTAKSVRELERALERSQRKVGQAALVLVRAALTAEDELARAELARSDKEQARDVAVEDRASYEEFDVPTIIGEAELSADRARSRLVSEQQDLQGILRIYAEEEEARSKDEIIRRHEVAVTFAERAVEAAVRRVAKAKSEVGATLRQKSWASEKAGRELELAARAVKRAKLSAELAALKARDALTGAQEDVAEAERKLAKKTPESSGEEE